MIIKLAFLLGVIVGIILGVIAIVALVLYSAHLDYKKSKKDNSEFGIKYQSSIKKYMK